MAVDDSGKICPIAVKGAAGLDADFEPVTDENKSSFRFFKVEVELP